MAIEMESMGLQVKHGEGSQHDTNLEHSRLTPHTTAASHDQP